MRSPSLDVIIHELREYPGLTRKKSAGSFRDLVGEFFGEDAGFFNLGEFDIAFTIDGIWHKVLDADLYWGGFISVLVNVHDIYAMGARPKFAVDVISAKDKESLEIMKKGIIDGAKTYRVVFLKGHVHPDSYYNSIDVAMIGLARKGSLIRSNTAKEGDSIVIAVDTDGKPHEKLPYNFDSTKKDPEILIKQLESMVYLAEKNLVNAGKDLSNAGIVGTIGMMLEVSGKGGYVDIGKIPMPKNVEVIQWLKTYPGCGFCVSTSYPEEVIDVFRRHGLEAAVVGEVNSSRVFTLRLNQDEKVFYDFRNESILGLV
ncbi:MAG: methanogenesis marker 2 protein [Thermoproteota archaeon]|uniref:Methanogenesis marker 2 protein n=1 Tax=Candidatus Methanodesulfokora washburnensis TaxID=2478471 RepID=A0A520KQZ9_9CREN|nr:MAG: methanogenesis marker 2 protein [Candidatus Methanodesulfokores washburnensis]TDA40891.1 MAG: methanogenesis marker 2 protein [Candidatus Korarchaeota archaeon]